MKFQIINGNLLPTEDALIPISDLGLLRSYSIFDYFRVLSGVPVFIDDHLDRLLRSASIMDLDLKWDSEEIKSMCYELIAANRMVDAGLRIVVTGGYSDDGYTPTVANIYMTLSHLPTYHKRDYSHGRTLIASNYTRDVPQVKTTIYIHSIQHQSRMKNTNAIEILYHSNGIITEGSRSNIFFVDQNNNLITPSINILQGITRRHVIQLAQKKYSVIEREIKMDEFSGMKEAFLTSSTKGVMPVIRIEDTVIGNGKVGDMTLDLHESFNHHLAEYIDSRDPIAFN